MLSAEELLPLCVFVLIRSALAKFAAEIVFINEFLEKSAANDREGYMGITFEVSCSLFHQVFALNSLNVSLQGAFLHIVGIDIDNIPCPPSH